MRKQAPRRNTSSGGGRKRAAGPVGARRGRPSGKREEGAPGERGTKRPYASGRKTENNFAGDKPWKKRSGDDRPAERDDKRPARGGRFAGRDTEGAGRERGRKPYSSSGPERRSSRYSTDKPWKSREGEEGAGSDGRRPSGNRRFSGRGEDSGRGRKPYGAGRKGAGAFGADKPWKKRPGDDIRAEKEDKRSAYERRVSRKTRESGENPEEKRPYTRRAAAPQEGEKPWKKRSADEGTEKPASRPPRRDETEKRGAKTWEDQERSTSRRPASRGTYERTDKPKYEEGRRGRPGRTERPGRERSEKPESSRSVDEKAYVKKRSFGDKKSPATGRKTYAERGRREEKLPEITEDIRLNKFLANAGLCSRREADTFIQSGVVTVNGIAITEMGYKVKPGDEIKFGGRAVRREKSVYILMNKAKDHITTTDDPEGRKTVMELLKDGPKERVFPVGRLDRNTTGILLFTNDGDLAERLMHPRYNIKKVYLAVLDKRLARAHMDELMQGIELEDGPIKADDIAYIAEDKKNIGIEIHSGRNRIIHRMFEHLGYKVEKLDRTSYAGLSKKELKRGEWRHLHEDELWALKKLVKLI